ncbi:Rho-type GTPase activating protein Rga1 [Rhodotorula toruloides]
MSSRQPEASTSAHPFEHPVAHSPLSTSPTRYGDHDHLAAHAHYDGSSRRNQPARDGSGSSGASPSRTGSRGPSPARGGSGDSDGGAYRRKGSDTMSSSRQNSGERGLGQIQEHSEAGLAGRGAGGQGLGRGGGLPQQLDPSNSFADLPSLTLELDPLLALPFTLAVRPPVSHHDKLPELVIIHHSHAPDYREQQSPHAPSFSTFLVRLAFATIAFAIPVAESFGGRSLSYEW